MLNKSQEANLHLVALGHNIQRLKSIPFVQLTLECHSSEAFSPNHAV